MSGYLDRINAANDIKKILSEEFNYSLVCDDVGMFVADREEKCLYMGGKDLLEKK